MRRWTVVKSGDTLEVPQLGVRVEVRSLDEEQFEFEVVGRARGFLTAEHVHLTQSEHHEVIEGAMNLQINGVDHILRAGESMEVPIGTPHRQLPWGDGPNRTRVRLRPGRFVDRFFERLAQISRDGGFNRWGYPKPVAGATIIREFGDEAHATKPPLPVQKAFARTVLAVANLRSREYKFVDEWDVAAPPEAVFDAISDARTYPTWWSPVYIDVDAEGEAALGKTSRQHFKGRLPYHLHTESTIVRLEPPHVVEADVVGDLSGHGKWTLTPTATGTHVRFDWEVFADKPLLRILTPLLKPAFRWNHNWAIARAREGLEPYAQRTAQREAVA
jgi:uncharacterized protein YndB with AHSA1/START domain/mannose-6-phosphate isomerase-like protein (cupin superfamily)